MKTRYEQRHDGNAVQSSGQNSPSPIVQMPQRREMLDNLGFPSCDTMAM